MSVAEDARATVLNAAFATQTERERNITQYILDALTVMEHITELRVVDKLIRQADDGTWSVTSDDGWIKRSGLSKYEAISYSACGGHRWRY